jgi:hypothetical protein
MQADKNDSPSGEKQGDLNKEKDQSFYNLQQNDERENDWMIRESEKSIYMDEGRKSYGQLMMKKKLITMSR